MKLYIFDMGEVLINNVKCLQAMAEKYGLDYPSFRADYGLYDKALMDGFMDPDLFYRHMEKKYDIRIGEELFVTCFHPVYNEATNRLARMIRERGDRAVIGSNTFEPHVRYVHEHFPQLVGNFDHPYFSNEMGLSKPDACFWTEIMKSEGFRDPKEVFFIDDRTDNLEAAASLGISTFRYLGNDDELYAWAGF